MIQIPVLTKNVNEFGQFVRIMVGKQKNTSNIVITRTRLVLQNHEYFYVESERSLRGKRFKNFEQFGTPWMRLDYGEVMEAIEYAIQRSDA